MLFVRVSAHPDGGSVCCVGQEAEGGLSAEKDCCGANRRKLILGSAKHSPVQ